MDDQTAASTATVSAAEKIMTAAGWRRDAGGDDLGVWRKDHEGGEYSLITSAGDCDADPLEIVWTCGRYRNAGAAVDVIMSPHHTSLARALEDVAKLTVPDDEPEAPAPKVEQRFADQPDRHSED